MKVTFDRLESGRTIVTVNGVEIGYIYCEVDGFYVFEIASRLGGYWSEWVLRDIADQLHYMNKEWEQQINEDLTKAEVDDLRDNLELGE